MRLWVRTGLASFAAAFVVLLAIGLVFRGQLSRVLQERVDTQLEQRAETAPVLAAIADRLSTSELSGTVEGARVERDGEVIELGILPDDPLPAELAAGWSTVSADGQRWRLHTIDVHDVPEVGDFARVQMVAPLGDVDSSAARARRSALFVGLLASLAAGVVGALLGAVAARPLTLLRRDAARLDGGDPSTWSVGEDYGTPEVDEVAATLNANLGLLAAETVRRGEALEAARGFASAATHELRTPLQGALTNIDIARAAGVGVAEADEAVDLAHDQLQRMASSLSAVRALSDAEFADPAWFEPVELADVVDAAVAEEQRRHPAASIELVAASEESPVPVWRDGVQLAVANVVRNAIVHGRRGPDDQPRIVVTVSGRTITVDDDGPGIAPDDRARLLQRFERGSTSSGSGLGLTIANEVARAHGGALTVDDSPRGGTRVTLRLAPPV